MTFEKIIQKLSESKKAITYTKNNDASDYSLSNEALFQLPLLSMIILVFAKGYKKPFVSEIGQLVGETIERTFLSFKGSSQLLGWSTNMRIRTIDALHFLELSKLIIVEEQKIKTTKLGRKIITQALKDDNNLSIMLLQAEINYLNIKSIKQLELELY